MFLSLLWLRAQTPLSSFEDFFPLSVCLTPGAAACRARVGVCRSCDLGPSDPAQVIRSLCFATVVVKSCRLNVELIDCIKEDFGLVVVQ